MSFYGSIYYQATQAFAKILLKNSGIDNLNFYTGNLDNSSIESGSRNGAFYVDNGNRWIQIVPDTDGFSIWHNTPRDGEGLSFTQGMRVNNNIPSLDNVTSLESGDILEIPLLYYDEAGHLSPAKSGCVYYKMPVIQIESDIDTLTNKVAENEKNIDALQKNVNTLTTDVSGHGKSIEQLNTDLKESVGDLRSITQQEDSIANVIGYFQDLRNIEQNEVLTISDILVSQKNSITSLDTSLNETIKNQETIFADLVKRVGALEDAVKNLTTT